MRREQEQLLTVSVRARKCELPAPCSANTCHLSPLFPGMDSCYLWARGQRAELAPKAPGVGVGV